MNIEKIGREFKRWNLVFEEIECMTIIDYRITIISKNESIERSREMWLTW